MTDALRLSVALAAFAVFAAPASPGVVGLANGTSPSARAAMPRLYSSCKNFNAKYPHGLGRRLARDKVRPGNEPVTNFLRSNRLFERAMSYNKGLDRDKDKIACEKH